MTSGGRDLSGFRKPGRAGGLTGKLGPRPTASVSASEQPATDLDSSDEPPTPDATAEPDDAPPRPMPPVEQEQTSRSRPRRQQKGDAPAPEPDRAVQRKQSWSVYLPGPVFEKARTVQGRRSYGEVVLDAFEDTYDQLAGHFSPPPESRSGLPPRTRRPRRDMENLQEVHLRWTKEEYDVVEARRVALGAPARSEFVTTILELYLKMGDGE